MNEVKGKKGEQFEEDFSQPLNGHLKVCCIRKQPECDQESRDSDTYYPRKVVAFSAKERMVWSPDY
jgi:hypothetical protein